MARPDPGEIHAFETGSGMGRYAALKIIGVSNDMIAVAVLDGVWDRIPTLSEARGSGLLREHRFAFEGHPATFGLYTDWWNPAELRGPTLLGSAVVTADEAEAARQILHVRTGCSYAPLSTAAHAVENEWRWANHREAFVAEVEAQQAANGAKRAAQEERYRTRLSKLTWDQLLAETPFQRWTPSPPFPPEDFTLAARTVIHDACRALSTLGPKPRKAEVRALLKGCVDWFNAADRAAGEVIETEEREDICAVLEEMAFVARQKALVDEIDVWREW